MWIEIVAQRFTKKYVNLVSHKAIRSDTIVDERLEIHPIARIEIVTLFSPIGILIRNAGSGSNGK